MPSGPSLGGMTSQNEASVWVLLLQQLETSGGITAPLLTKHGRVHASQGPSKGPPSDGPSITQGLSDAFSSPLLALPLVGCRPSLKW